MTNMIDKDYQHRIDYEIVVDCYDEYEQAMGWIIYLSENLKCPFKAQYIEKSDTFHIKPEEIIEVLQLVNSEDDEDEELEYFEAMVEVKVGNNVYDIPLSEIKGIDVDEQTEQAIEDWRYWKRH